MVCEEGKKGIILVVKIKKQKISFDCNVRLCQIVIVNENREKLFSQG